MTEKIFPQEVRELLERASRGDVTALPAVRQAFKDHPELVAALGDLALHAQESLLALATGDCLTAREAIRLEVADLRARLAETTCTELEKLLVERIVVTYIEVFYFDVDLARHLKSCPGSSPALTAAERRLDRAHNRYLTAIRTLATVSRLLKPVPSPVDLLCRPIPETTGFDRGNESRSRGMGVTSVAN